MALQPGTRSIGIRPPTGTPGGVDARIPIQRDLGVGEAAQALVRPLVAQEEDRIKRDFADRANAAEMGRDAQGNLQRPADPEGMGSVAANAWREALDRRFVFQTVQDAVGQFNQLREDSNGDPIAFGQLAGRAAEARLAATDPRLRGVIAPYLTREINERWSQMSNLATSQERQATVQAVQAERTTRLGEALDYLSAGNEGSGTRALSEWRAATQTLRGLRADASTPETIANIEQSVRLGGRLMNAVGRALETNNLSPDDARRLSLLMDGTPVGGSVLGFTAEELVGMDRTVRRELDQRINRALRESAAQMAGQQQEQRVNTVLGVLDRGNTTLTEQGVTGALATDVLGAFVRREGINPATPEGLARVVGYFGEVPETLINSTLRGVRGMDAARVERAHGLYMTLGSIVGRDGITTNLQHVIPSQDLAFLYHYDLARGASGTTPDQAVQQARAAVAAGLNHEPERNRAVLARAYETTADKLDEKIADGLSPSLWTRDRTTFRQLPSEARQELEGHIAQLHVLGIPIQAAQEIAVRRFRENWTSEDRFTVDAGLSRMRGGSDQAWVRRSTLPPAIRDVFGGEPHRDYLGTAVNLVLDQRLGQQLIPVERAQLRLGETVFLQPPRFATENPSYTLTYLGPGGIPQPLVGTDGNPLRIYLGRVVQQQREFADGFDVARAATRRMVNERVAVEEDLAIRFGAERGALSPEQRADQDRQMREATARTAEARETLGRFNPVRVGAPNDEFGLVDEANMPLRSRPSAPIRLEDLDPPPAMRRASLGQPSVGTAGRDVRRSNTPPGEIPPMWRSDFSRAVESAGVDGDLFANLVRVESSWRPGALSERGAGGLSQLMPETAAELAARWGGDPSRPADNLRLGAQYLRQMLDQFGGDDVLAVAAYNMGPRALRDFMEGRRPLPDETVGHVMRVFRLPSTADARLEIMRRARGE